MSVGKGSIQRAAKAKEKKEPAAEKRVMDAEMAEAADMEQKETTNMTAKTTAKSAGAAPKKKTAAAKKTVKKAPVKKQETVVAASVISSDDIHEKKFEAVSHIYCELPTYLL